MGPPVCQIKAYQKVSPKLKHTGITQNSQIRHGNWKRSNVCKKNQQNLQKLLKY